MEKTVNIDAILALAESADECCIDILNTTIEKQKCHIAIAKDNAFCFYYQDNIQYLKQKGCHITFLVL